MFLLFYDWSTCAIQSGLKIAQWAYKISYRWIYDTLVEYPVKRLYFNGPELRLFGTSPGGGIHIGFWRGVPETEICAQMTGVSELHWRDHIITCHEMIDRQFKSFMVGIEFLLYIYFMLQLIRFVLIMCGRYQLVAVALFGNKKIKQNSSRSKNQLTDDQI